MGVRNIVFDFGGVLIDWNPRHLYRDVFADETAMERFLAEVCTGEWNGRVDAGYPMAQATADLQARFPAYRDLIAMYYGEWIRMVRGEIVENTRLIAPLKARYRIFGLSNWSAETFGLVLDRFPFFREFDGMVISGDEGVTKPDPRIYEILLTRYGLDAGECLFIDDNRANTDAAARLGFGTLYLAPGVNLQDSLVEQGVL